MDEEAAEVVRAMVASRLDQWRRYTLRPSYQSWLADARAQWKARPWYERAWIVTKSRIRGWRVRAGIWIGELIAGQSLSDY
jgi:hypothetical protein